jgi:hypothetical protein
MSSCARLLAVLVCLVFSLPAFSGEPQWVEIHSPHFSVITDAGDRRGRDAAVRFEQMRAVFGSLMVKAKVNTPIPLQIVAFRNSKELRQFAPIFQGKPTELAGLFQGSSDRCFILLDMSAENPWQTVFHEYAHQLMNGTIPTQLDPWFEEGFAEYFRTITVDGKEADVGKIPDDEYYVLDHKGWLKIADLLRVQQYTKTYNESGDHRTPKVVPAKFLHGKLLSVDCSGLPVATLTLLAGPKIWTLRVADSKKAIVIGADQMSCDWKGQKVAVNYRETGDGQGDLISLEVH